ncbi:hypothetical protein B0H10DRAFT_2262871 [Mycena sp. CBHHK59/15]|nr:hypothetical protein B0H10DRAFT_2262871 [Mycena sp. CBHHK59/15]
MPAQLRSHKQEEEERAVHEQLIMTTAEDTPLTLPSGKALDLACVAEREHAERFDGGVLLGHVGTMRAVGRLRGELDAQRERVALVRHDCLERLFSSCRVHWLISTIFARSWSMPARMDLRTKDQLGSRIPRGDPAVCPTPQPGALPETSKSGTTTKTREKKMHRMDRHSCTHSVHGWHGTQLSYVSLSFSLPHSARDSSPAVKEFHHSVSNRDRAGLGPGKLPIT